MTMVDIRRGAPIRTKPQPSTVARVGTKPASSIVVARGTKPASSIVVAVATKPASSTIDPRIAAIERERAQKQISHAELRRRSGVDRMTWLNLRLGLQPPRATTIARLRKALDSTRAPPSLDAIAGMHRLAMMWLAMETGADVETMMAQDFTRERPKDPVWLKASHLRRYAMYVAAVELQVENVKLGAAIGCSRQNVKQAREWVEEQRENPAVERLLERCTRLVTGRTE